MSRVWLTSDWHLGHYGCTKWRTDFPSYMSMVDRLLTDYLSKVKKRDLVWFLGDTAFTPEALEVIAELPGDKRLVLGNHCTERKNKATDFVKVFTQVHGMVKYKDAWLTHCPIHPEELRGKFNFHGHVHEHTLKDSRYFNVCGENTNYELVDYQQCINKLREENNRKTGDKRSPPITGCL